MRETPARRRTLFGRRRPRSRSSVDVVKASLQRDKESARTLPAEDLSLEDFSSLDSSTSHRFGILKYPTQLLSLQQTYSSTMQNKKSVGFGSVQISSHEIILGDNPAVTCGPPVSIAWECFHEAQCSVDEYESNHEQPRRTKLEMMLPRAIREDLVMAIEPRSEIASVLRETGRIRQNRMQTAHKYEQHEKLRKLFHLARK